MNSPIWARCASLLPDMCMIATSVNPARVRRSRCRSERPGCGLALLMPIYPLMLRGVAVTFAERPPIIPYKVVNHLCRFTCGRPNHCGVDDETDIGLSSRHPHTPTSAQTCPHHRYLSR